MYIHITPSVLATEAVMTLAGFPGVVVWVEGPTDVRIFEELLSEHFRVIHGVNKDIAIEALSILDCVENISDEKKRRVVALVDADFDRPLVIQRHSRAFLTDFHDMEVMILWSDAFIRWLREYASDMKLAQFGGVDSVRAKLIEVGRFLGAMRLLGRKHSVAIDFSNIRYGTYFDKRTLELNSLGFCLGLYEFNRDVLQQYNVASLRLAAEKELELFRADDRDLVQGHDLINLLGILMRSALASLDASMCSEESIAPSLRLAYRQKDWKDSRMAESFNNYLVENGLARAF